jgi:ATP-dependent protease HslVU (ClpYQ) peptidase subunit
MFDYGAMMSDVRVTFSDGSERDLVQKAYSVGPYILAGFAGSVKIGFQLIESLARFLIVPPDGISARRRAVLRRKRATHLFTGA